MKVSFSFGRNWYRYVKKINENDVERAEEDLKDWLNDYGIKDKRIIDIGCGSGIHTLSFKRLGAEAVVSFDYDSKSVKATTWLLNKYSIKEGVKVFQGSVLDDRLIASLGTFDLVYSWGVLHHTGQMWKAIENAAKCVSEKGMFMLSIYVKGPRYEVDLAMKERYNRYGIVRKNAWILKRVLQRMKAYYKAGRNPFEWNTKYERGMNYLHDLIDWLGGLPYEVASEEEISGFLGERGFKLMRATDLPEGHCNIYLFSRVLIRCAESVEL